MAMNKAVVVVVDESKETHQDYKQGATTGGTWEVFTVWRQSPRFRCEGFSVYDSTGNLVFRVENYTGRPARVVLMDGSGKALFTTCRRKKFGLIDNWVVHEGEIGRSSPKKPMYYVRKNNTLLQHNSNLLAHVYHDSSDKKYAYAIQGSYSHRSCQVLDDMNQVKAEIKRKEATNNNAVSFGLEVFQLIIEPGFLSKFTMAIILCLDQMCS